MYMYMYTAKNDQCLTGLAQAFPRVPKVRSRLVAPRHGGDSDERSDKSILYGVDIREILFIANESPIHCGRASRDHGADEMPVQLISILQLKKGFK
ncbi:hypothetical protein I7I48_03282 [Histoplasma ohiense]|nr:hypothetical protein I7I48_03282 [Histoplasma ohiense (nom. inval.)]